MAQSADDLRGEIPPRQRHTPTASTALAKITEAVNQIKTLTSRSIAKEDLWDVTESTLQTLRNKFSSGLCLLKALWYAEPVRLVTIGRWMSRIDRETTNELNALDAHIQTRNEYEEIWTTRDDYEDTHQHGPNMANTHHNHDEHNDTASGNHCDTPPSHDKYREDPTNDSQRTNNCWPPTGGCQ